MITYPTIFWGVGQGPLREDFDDYSAGALPTYDQIWQYQHHNWLTPKVPTKYVGFTWKDFGISGAFDSFDSWTLGTVNLSDYAEFQGEGNFEIRPFSGLSAGFFRDARGHFNSADQIRGYPYINFNWGTQPPLIGYKSDQWSARFIAKLTLPYNGTYQFFVEKDDAARIYVGRESGPSTLVYDGWNTPPTPLGVLDPGIPFNFSAGIVDILVEYFDDSADARLRLYWNKPTHDGGGAEGPTTIITPDYFGDPFYVRVFTPYGPFSSQGEQIINMDGQVRYAYVTGDAHREDFAKTDLYMTGNYAIGVIYTDPRIDYSYSQIRHEGYYAASHLSAFASDFGKNEIDQQGFYAYKVAHVPAIDQAGMNLGFFNANYIYAIVNSQTTEYVRSSQTLAGLYTQGVVTGDRKFHAITNEINPAGFYIPLYVPNFESDFGVTNARLEGAYYPRYAYTKDRDYGLTSLRPSGHYITGYINLDTAHDFGKTQVNPIGNYVYYLSTFDKVEDKGGNNIGFDYGLYFYKYYNYNDKDYSNNLISPNGIYFARYSYQPYREFAETNLDTKGLYYYKAVDVYNREYSYNKIRPEGYHITGYVNPYTRENASNYVSPAGHYVSGYNQVAYFDTSRNVLNSAGSYFYRLQHVRNQEYARNLIGYDGTYQSIFIYTSASDEGRNIIDTRGQYYYIYSAVYGTDISKNILNVNGYYRLANVKTYDVDAGGTVIDPSGYYLFGYVADKPDGSFGNEFLDLNGVYFYRFNQTYDRDYATGNMNFNGYYAPYYVDNHAAEAVSGCIDFQGIYFGRFLENRYIEATTNIIGINNSIYYPIYLPIEYDDQGNNYLDMQGELIYTRVVQRHQEPAYNVLGLIDSSYFTRFVYNKAVDYSKNLLVLAGEYIKDSYLASDSSVIEINFASEFVSFFEIQEFASVSATLSGSFAAAQVSTTLDYWLEIYQRPTYNMGKSQAYFSI